MRAQQIMNRSRRWQVAALAITLGAAALVAATTAAPAEATSTWRSFAGTGVGAIPDGGGGCVTGAPLVVSFTVSGVPAGSLSGVRITNLNVTHTWVADVTATLTAPDASSVVLFSRTGAASGGSFGDSSDLAGPYTFSDAVTPNNWWTDATAAGSSEAVPAGRYHANTPGGVADGGASVSITDAFSGIPDPNGMWTLAFTDRCQTDTGSVASATLQLQPSAGLGPCAAFQNAADLAAGTVQDDWLDVTTAQDAVANAADAVGAAGKAKEAATTNAATAQAAATAAASAVTAANAGVAKATAALKKAKKSKNKAKIAKATTALKAAKAKQKAATGAAATAQAALTAAGATLSAATQAVTDRNAELDLATAISDNARMDLASAQDVLADRKRELALCLDA